MMKLVSLPEMVEKKRVPEPEIGHPSPVRVPVPLNRAQPLRIDAVAVACGGKLAAELGDLLCTLEVWHPVPVYALVDEAAASVIAGLPERVRRWVTVDLLQPGELVSYGEVAAADHGERWSRPWIGAKLEALRRAVAMWPARGVAFMDSDLVIGGWLGGAWMADLVLSDHQGPLSRSVVPRFHGRYNAGLLLTDRRVVVERWIELYRSGAAKFFEQGCLEQLSEEFVTATFPSEWNWGNWRHQEDVGLSGRRPAIVHVHREVFRPENVEGERLAQLAERYIEAARAVPAGIVAVVHPVKSAGTTLMRLLEERMARELGYRVFNSFSPAHGSLVRDWSVAELEGILREARQKGWRRVIVHNHAQAWPVELLGEFDRVIGLDRPVEERWESLWWHDLRHGDRVEGCDREAWAVRRQGLIDLERFAGQVEWWPSSSEGISALLAEVFGWEIEPGAVPRYNARTGF